MDVYKCWCNGDDALRSEPRQARRHADATFVGFIWEDKLEEHKAATSKSGEDFVYEKVEGGRLLILSFTALLKHRRSGHTINKLDDLDGGYDGKDALYFTGCGATHILGELNLDVRWGDDGPMSEWIADLRREGMSDEGVLDTCRTFQTSYKKAMDEGRVASGRQPENLVRLLGFHGIYETAFGKQPPRNYPGIARWIAEGNLPLVPLY